MNTGRFAICGSFYRRVCFLPIFLLVAVLTYFPRVPCVLRCRQNVERISLHVGGQGHPTLDAIVSERAGQIAVARRRRVNVQREERLVNSGRRETAFHREVLRYHNELTTGDVVDMFELARHVVGTPRVQVKVVPPLVIGEVPLHPASGLPYDTMRFVVAL